MEFTALVKEEDGLYIAEVLGLKGCHTQAKSRQELVGRIEEAIHLYIDGDVDLEVTHVFV